MNLTNKTTGEAFRVSNVTTDEAGRIIYKINGREWQRPGSRFFGNFPMLADTGQTTGDGWAILEIVDPSYEIGGKVTAPRAESETRMPEAVEAPAPTTTTAPTNQPTNQPTTTADDDAAQLVAILGRMKGGQIDEARVREIVRDAVAEYAAAKPETVKLAAKAAKQEGRKVYHCDNFDEIVRDIADGFNVYLYGPAGSGKSHTAEQIAEALGLDFYGQTTVQFAHDVRGYGDAGGNYVDTPFFKAFKDGGLYFQDEYDRSMPEAAIVLNTALDNGYYDFPVVGRVEAHPKFRFLAAGNTTMTGATEQYTTGQILDASSRDRFAPFFEVGYNHDVELNEIAKGDAELVDFVEACRVAIKNAGIMHVVSYRATKYMKARSDNKAATLTRCTFKGLSTDEIRIIFGGLTCDRDNEWYKATAQICR